MLESIASREKNKFATRLQVTGVERLVLETMGGMGGSRLQDMIVDKFVPRTHDGILSAEL